MYTSREPLMLLRCNMPTSERYNYRYRVHDTIPVPYTSLINGLLASRSARKCNTSSYFALSMGRSVRIAQKNHSSIGRRLRRRRLIRHARMVTKNPPTASNR